MNEQYLNTNSNIMPEMQDVLTRQDFEFTIVKFSIFKSSFNDIVNAWRVADQKATKRTYIIARATLVHSNKNTTLLQTSFKEYVNALLQFELLPTVKHKKILNLSIHGRVSS